MTGKLTAIIVCCAAIGGAAAGYNAPEVPGDGPFSSAMENLVAGAPDPAIPGFVGPDGDGMCLDAGPNNYVNPLFKGWATSVVDYSPSDATGSYGYDSIGNGFEIPENALGAVTGDNFYIVSLGDMDSGEILSGKAAGSVTLGFDVQIADGVGPDFGVFENGFISAGGAGVAGQIFAELGYVEVSTDGEVFARFPSEVHIDDLVGAYGTVDPTWVYNLVGKHVNAYGASWATPFDLAELAADELVTSGLVDLGNINYIRIVDIPGDGSFLDADGRSIYDAWVTWGSGGLDLEAIGVINHSQSLLAGDANGDATVDLDDFIILKQNYGTDAAGWEQGDFNHDTVIDLDDFIILKQNYGNTQQ